METSKSRKEKGKDYVAGLYESLYDNSKYHV